MNVVYLNPIGQPGGAELILLDVIASIRDMRPSLRPHVVVGTDGPLVGMARDLGVPVSVVTMPSRLASAGDSDLRERSRPVRAAMTCRRGLAAGWSLWRYARWLRAVVRELQPQLIHSNGIKYHLLSRLAGFDDLPLVWHMHDFIGTRPVVARGLRWASARPDIVLAVSQAVASDTRAVLDRVPVRMVYNGIDTLRFSPGKLGGESLDGLAGLGPAPSGTIRVGLVATYARWKGQDLFIDAAARLLARHSGLRIRFFIIGGPVYSTIGSQFSEPELRRAAEARGLKDHLGLIGFQKEAQNVYRALDVVVHASTHAEPFGRTIVEAMACGRPVVVSNAGGAAEIFLDGIDAIGVPPNDADALAEAIARLARDPEMRRRIGAAARRTVAERFSRERLGAEILDVYDSLIRDGAAAGVIRRSRRPKAGRDVADRR